MKPERYHSLTERFAHLRIVVLGDFCLDRYLEIDPGKRERSIETGLPVHNVINVRAQPGGAGTVLNNLVALGAGNIYPVGFRGMDGEGKELEQALLELPRVFLRGFISTRQRRTFTYAKPLLVRRGGAPVELNRLDFKNWSSTPPALRKEIVDVLLSLARRAHAIIVLDQVDVPETGVVTRQVLKALSGLSRQFPRLFIIADSRQRISDFPPVALKMNRAELGQFARRRAANSVQAILQTARELAARNRRPVFVTLAERGMVGALPSGEAAHVPALPVRGPIDIVGAGDAVTAALTCAMVSGATLLEALEFANAAASVVIHKLGTTGTASLPELRARLGANRGRKK